MSSLSLEAAGPGKSLAETEKQSAATSSVWAAVFLTVIKLIVAFATGSLGMLAEAAHSGLDLVAALVTFLAVHLSDRPADEHHTYGHGKIENFSALIEALLLVITCVWIVYESVQRLFFKAVAVDANVWAFVVMLLSIVINISRSRMLYATARKHHSQALEADALHFRTDVWSSYVVLGGLGLVWLGANVLPQYQEILTKADALAALGVAIIVAFVTYDLGKRTVEVLLDTAPSGIPQQIAAAATTVDGVLSVDQVRVRRSGPGLFVDMTVAVDRNLSFERTHELAEAVESQVRAIAPGADVVVHTDPRENERENVAERARAVAADNQAAIHNITVQESDGKLYVDLHLEVDDHLSLRQAHDISRHIEEDLRQDNPRIAHVNTHIESRGTGIGNGQDVTAEEPAMVRRIRELTNDIAGPAACHDIHVRRQGDRYVASLHCTFDDNLPIVQVHETSSRIEAAVQGALPTLDRVLVHAEPHEVSKPA